MRHQVSSKGSWKGSCNTLYIYNRRAVENACWKMVRKFQDPRSKTRSLWSSGLFLRYGDMRLSRSYTPVAACLRAVESHVSIFPSLFCFFFFVVCFVYFYALRWFHSSNYSEASHETPSHGASKFHDIHHSCELNKTAAVNFRLISKWTRSK